MFVARSPRYLLSILMLSLFLVETASAFSFKATNDEYYRWPDECKLIYASTQKTHFKHDYSKAERKRGYVLAQRWGGAWHWCAALTLIERGNRETNKNVRAYHYKRAVANAKFTYESADPEDSKRAEFGVTLAQALRKHEEPEAAVEVLAEVIGDFPGYPTSYSLLSILYRENDDMDKALDVLLKGNHNTKEKSAEIQYFLGLFYANLGNLEEAQRYAEKAYALGYPLPGLKRKIKRLEKAAAKKAAIAAEAAQDEESGNPATEVDGGKAAAAGAPAESAAEPETDESS